MRTTAFLQIRGESESETSDSGSVDVHEKTPTWNKDDKR